MTKTAAIIQYKNRALDNEYINDIEIEFLMKSIENKSIAFYFPDEIEFIIDAETYCIVYENVDHKLIKIDDFNL